MSALRPLLAGIVDYAGLFPPAGLDMATAIRNYAEYRHGVRELCAQFDSTYWQEVDEEPRASRRPGVRR